MTSLALRKETEAGLGLQYSLRCQHNFALKMGPSRTKDVKGEQMDVDLKVLLWLAK